MRRVAVPVDERLCDARQELSSCQAPYWVSKIEARYGDGRCQENPKATFDTSMKIMQRPRELGPQNVMIKLEISSSPAQPAGIELGRAGPCGPGFIRTGMRTRVYPTECGTT